VALVQDPLILWGLGERQRYAPPVLAISAYLAASSAAQLVAGAAAGADSLADAHAAEFLYLARNAACLLLTVPAHVAFLSYLWTRTRVANTAQLFLVPLNVAALVLTDLRSVRVLAGLSFAMLFAQGLLMRHVRQVGMKLI
jgi:hypothetical protein